MSGGALNAIKLLLLFENSWLHRHPTIEQHHSVRVRVTLKKGWSRVHKNIVNCFQL
jgi:hypothetical protein